MSLSRIAIVGIGLTFAISTVRAGITREERIIAGSPADSMEVRYLYLKGSNEQIGRALAEIARDRYQAKLPPSPDPLRTRAGRLYIEKNYPILYDRMRGVAAAYGQRIDDDRWDYTALGFTELHAGCSIVHLPPQATATKVGIVSRDYDYSTGSLGFGFLAPGMLHPTARPYLLELHPDRGYASLAMVAYDLLSGVLDGINSEGLTVTMALDDELFATHRMEPTLTPSVGMSELQVLRLLLDTAATAAEAKQVLLQTKQYYAFVPVHYLVADRFGNSFVWEYSQAHNKEFIIENPNQPLVMTNFSLNLHLNQGRPPSAEQAGSVCKRYSLLMRELAVPPERRSEDVVRATHKKVDAELPQSADKSRPPVRTFWHALYYPEQRRLRISYYLHDDPLPDQPDRARVVRSKYLEFTLSPTNQGQGSPPAAASPPQQNPVETKTGTIVEELERGGAKVKLDGTRIVAVDFNSAGDLAHLLPLLRKLPDLSELTIQTPKMDDAGMNMLEGLPKLARLNLYSAAVTDAGVMVLKTLPSLRYLPIGGTKITDAGLVRIAELSKLEYLGLRGDNITDAGLTSLRGHPRLNTLNLSETRVTDAGLVYLKDCGQLEVLQLSADRISDAGMAELARLTKLTGLFLDGTQVTDAGLQHLRSMSRLTKLNVANTGVTDKGIADARKFLPFWITIQK
jgi:hypothetical protein